MGFWVPGAVLQDDISLTDAANVVKEENARVAQAIGINKAARTTCVKPAGTTSLALGTSSGIHAWHNDYYIRRIRVGKNEPIHKNKIKTGTYFVEKIMPELIMYSKKVQAGKSSMMDMEVAEF